MKSKVLAVALVMGLASAARADVASGERAYLAGDYAKALAELRPAARQGEPQAQYLLGVMHDHGQGLARNYREAADWYRRAAQQGHAEAAFSLGFMYYNGAGDGDNAVPMDLSKARQWLQTASDAGNGMAQGLLAEIYYKGYGVEQDRAHAAQLALAAASQGVQQGQYYAGLMLANGEGVERDLVSAYAYFAVLAEKGYPGATWNRDAVAEVLTEEQLAEGRAKAERIKRQG